MNNPYEGTEWADIWKQGYEAGVAAPEVELSPPTPLDVDAQQVYMEGVLAGQRDGRLQGSPVELNPQQDPEPESVLHTVTKGFGLGMLVVEVFHKSPIGFAIELLVLSCEAETFPADLSDPDQLGPALVAACRSKGAEEMFLPLCQANDHSESGDLVRNAGYWHGDMYLDFWAAYNAAAAHLSNEPDSAGQVGVIRVRSDSSALVEWIAFE